MVYTHPSPELLVDYAAGGVRLSRALCIAAHLEHCDVCRHQLAKLQTVGTQLFQSSPIAGYLRQDYSNLKQSVLSQLDSLTEETKADDTPLASQSKDYRVPKSLGQFIRHSYDELKWTRVSPSIRIAELSRESDGSQIALSRVKAGGRLPHHRHTGEEITMVLEGSFSDESGVFHKGDFILRDSRHRHKPVVTKDAECICLMVMDEPIQFTGTLTRWLNPIVRRYHMGA